MKGPTAIGLLLALSAAAVAKPAPTERLRPTLALDETGINISATTATTPEREYFQASQPQFNAGGFPCRLPLIVFDKTRVASSCR